MQNPHQGMDNPNQNPYTGGEPRNMGQGPYRQSDMNPPNQNPFQPTQPGQEPFQREAAPMPEQEQYQQQPGTPQRAWGQPGQEQYQQQPGAPQPAWGQPGQEQYQQQPGAPQPAWGQPGQEQYRGTAMNQPGQGAFSGEAVGQQPGQVTAADYSVPSGLPFNQQEWQTLVSTPIQVSLAMMGVSPSGILGMIQEAMAIGKSVQALQAQGNLSPVLVQIGQQLTRGLEDMRAGRANPFGDIRQMAQNPEGIRNISLASCQRSASILERTSPRDAMAFKQFVYSFAYNVAAAAREGGFLGFFGGEQISPAENAFLNDVATALRLQRS